MRAHELMTYPPITCHVNDSLSRAAQLMWDHDCGVIVVVNDEGRLAGMITDRDICMAAFTQGKALSDLLVNAAMASHVVAADPDSTIDELERMMAGHQIRRIPIVDDHRQPLGVVSIADLVREAARPGGHAAPGALVRGLAQIARPHRDLVTTTAA